MGSHLYIDSDRCIGCGSCASVCIRGNIRIRDKKATESNDGTYECFDCGHCMSVCPRDAIRLLRYPDESQVRGYNRNERLILIDDLEEFLLRRRTCRWFRKEPIYDHDMRKMLSVVGSSPTAENTQAVEVAVVSRRLGEFMTRLREILESRRADHPRIDQFCGYVDDGMPPGNNPFLWEGRQLLLFFSKHPIDAVLAACRVEMAAYAMGFGGFYSRWVQLAEEAGHDRLMEFFPEVPADMGMNAAFVVGRPRTEFRRTVPRSAPKIHWC